MSAAVTLLTVYVKAVAFAAIEAGGLVVVGFASVVTGAMDVPGPVASVVAVLGNES